MMNDESSKVFDILEQGEIFLLKKERAIYHRLT